MEPGTNRLTATGGDAAKCSRRKTEHIGVHSCVSESLIQFTPHTTTRAKVEKKKEEERGIERLNQYFI